MTKNDTAGAERQRSGSSERQARQAAALRENLRKRKAQQRQRLAAEGPDHPADKASESRAAAAGTLPNSNVKARGSA